MRRGQRFYFRKAELGPSLCMYGPEHKLRVFARLPVSTSVSACFQITTLSSVYFFFLVLSLLLSLSHPTWPL